jgi:hypothetical protein
MALLIPVVLIYYIIVYTWIYYCGFTLGDEANLFLSADYDLI